MYEKYLTQNEDLPIIKRFAFVGTYEGFNNMLNYLSRLAEKENWTHKDLNNGVTNSVLFYYIVHTFDRCYKQNKVYINDKETIAAFNTGLLTAQGNEIIAIFEPSNMYNENDKSTNYWRLSKFVAEHEKDFLNLCINKPKLATYFDNFNELYFEPECEITINFDHIYDDNFDRLPSTLTIINDKESIKHVFDGFLNHTIKKIKRNNRIPVPQFYKDKIMFLIPVRVFNDTVVIALEKIGNRYSANTVLTMGMAYNCARLINKPESNWLLTNS